MKHKIVANIPPVSPTEYGISNGEYFSASKLNEMKDNDVVANNEAEQH